MSNTKVKKKSKKTNEEAKQQKMEKDGNAKEKELNI